MMPNIPPPPASSIPLSSSGPQPSSLFKISAYLLINLCVVLLAVLSVSMYTQPLGDAIVTGVFFLLPLIAIAWLQYRSVFALKDGPCIGLAVCCFGIAALATAGLGQFLFYIVTDNTHLADALELAFWFGGVAAYACFNGILALIWRRRLVCFRLKSEPCEPQQPVQSTKSLTRNRRIDFVFLVIVPVLTVCVIWAYADKTRFPRVAHNVPHDQAPISGLPSEATNVSYYTRMAFDPSWGYEFTINEQGFLAWAQENDWPVKPIGPKPYEIRRYTSCTGGPWESTRAVISQGYDYQQTEEDRGLYIAYDRKNQRAYFFTHTR